MNNQSISYLLGALVVLCVMIAIYTLLIMVIWNNVLVSKIKGANLQKLTFWDALAIGVFFSLMSGGVYNVQTNINK